jgi:eukaryotic-like serine/threonine-protein kinase
VSRKGYSERATTHVGRNLAERYRLGKKLGSGGTGSVYEAEHVLIGRCVAIKMIHPQFAGDEELCQRFRREAQVAGRISSRNVVGVLDFGFDENGLPFLVMDRPPGEDLKRILQKEGPLAPVRAVNLIAGACDGLVVVHAAGIVHRDLKPSNLLVSRDGVQEICQILDFGIAKLNVDGALHSLTQTGAVLGTLNYMSPEQAKGGTSVLDARTDIYSLGAVLYECLSGRPPHQAATAHELLQMVVCQTPIAIEELCPQIPKSLAQVVQQALAKNPKDRFASAGQFAEALAPYAGGTVKKTLAGLPLFRDEAVSVANASTMSALGTRPKRHYPFAIRVSLALLVAGTAGVALGNWLTKERAALAVPKVLEERGSASALVLWFAARAGNGGTGIATFALPDPAEQVEATPLRPTTPKREARSPQLAASSVQKTAADKAAAPEAAVPTTTNPQSEPVSELPSGQFEPENPYD